MFKDLGIKGRVLMLTLLPTSMLALVLGGYFIWMQLSDMQRQLLQRGQMIAEQLAPLAAPALQKGDAALLQRIASTALEQPDVRAVSFLQPERKRLAHAGPSMMTEAPASDGLHLSLLSGSDASRFLLPVLQSHRMLADDAAPADSDELIGWVELEVSHHGTLIRGYRSLCASLLLIVTGLIVTALTALRMSRAINEPLWRIKQGVAQLKEGRLETRLPPLGSHELDELAAGINRMAEALQNAQEELQHNVDQATEDLRQTLETIEIQNIELDLARKEALEASRIKSEFLANMSHEIRTPLNGILGFTNLLQKSELTSRQQDYLNTIEKSADSLLSIINEILDFSKIEAGKLMLEHIPFNLRDLLEDVLTILAPSAHAKQLELVSLVYRDTPLHLIGDPLRLKQVLTNLVNNAIKFTYDGSIVVRAMVEEDAEDHAQLRISVQDTGIGLSEDDLHALFQAFSQADNSMSRQAGGTGLGLVISKRLIEQMGGEIGVESSPDEGSEFWISLTLPKAQEHGDEVVRSALNDRRILLFEPHELARQAIQHQLEEFGLHVQGFDSIDALADMAKQLRNGGRAPDLALLCVSTPSLNPEQSRGHVEMLEHMGCRTMLLCPTTEQSLFHGCVPDAGLQLQAKPACTMKLQKGLSALLSTDVTYRSRQVTQGRAPRILCVDDNPANLLLVHTLLGDMGAQVKAVESGLAALEAMEDEEYDLVFMDVQMPGMDGRQTTDEIRRREALNGTRATPIVALTAHALANERRQLLQGGMDDYLTKPINERQLGQVVLKWTGLSLQSLDKRTIELASPERSEILVLDPEEGLRLAAGKADLAADMLDMLLASLDTDRQAIRQARDKQDREALIERVHRLHGATRYCGTPQLRHACQQCETLLKQNDPGAEQALDKLDAAIYTLATEARQLSTPPYS
ncbi:response regulator [Pseudomonas matsuisoli]|uniref:histidine kinase n=1 Tax=Pseudomonas matsuisoli TaxID=1515666 RepID=A0A917UWK7_9PSED|nr:response regulator [Pseudomonas matsuisoli]GGJ90833.1 histidine kinase [Pseudomonas matsuisoli]